MMYSWNMAETKNVEYMAINLSFLRNPNNWNQKTHPHIGYRYKETFWTSFLDQLFGPAMYFDILNMIGLVSTPLWTDRPGSVLYTFTSITCSLSAVHLVELQKIYTGDSDLVWHQSSPLYINIHKDRIQRLLTHVNTFWFRNGSVLVD